MKMNPDESRCRIDPCETVVRVTSCIIATDVMIRRHFYSVHVVLLAPLWSANEQLLGSEPTPRRRLRNRKTTFNWNRWFDAAQMIGSWKDCLFGGDRWRRRSRCASVVQELLNDHRYTFRSRLSPQTRILRGRMWWNHQNKAFRFMRRSLFSAHLQQRVTTDQMLQHQDCTWNRAETDQLSQNMLLKPSTQFWTHW